MSLENWEGLMPDWPYSWLKGTRDKGFSTALGLRLRNRIAPTQRCELPSYLLWGRWGVQNLPSQLFLPEIPSGQQRKVTRQLAMEQIPLASSFPVTATSASGFWLSPSLLDVWAEFTLEDFSLFFTLFFPKVKNSPQARLMTLDPLSLGRQLLFLQHSYATRPWVTWPTMVWISFLDEPCLLGSLSSLLSVDSARWHLHDFLLPIPRPKSVISRLVWAPESSGVSNESRLKLMETGSESSRECW